MFQDDSGKLIEINYICTADNTLQSAYIQKAFGAEPAPLVVGLHTWSYTWQDNPDLYGAMCRKRNWHYIHPDFRGKNCTSMACGSDFVVQDIADAVEAMKKIVHVDPKRIYLCGGSGGGYAALLMAGRHPEIWTAISSWCPIYNLAQWHAETMQSEHWKRYAREIERVCGGDPQKDPLVFQEAEYRSASTYLQNASSVPLDICTGIHDGHRGSVPVSHAIQAYNALALPADRIVDEDIRFIVENEKIPAHLCCQDPDPAFGKYTVLLRKQSANVRLTLFEGAHDILPDVAGDWFARQCSGETPDWGNGTASSGEAAYLPH